MVDLLKNYGIIEVGNIAVSSFRCFWIILTYHLLIPQQVKKNRLNLLRHPQANTKTSNISNQGLLINPHKININLASQECHELPS